MDQMPTYLGVEAKRSKQKEIGRCALCLEDGRELLESHLLAAGFLRRLLGDGNGNPNPFLMSQNWVGQTSKQAMQPLLCGICEERLNKNGERWVIAHCYNPQCGKFPLRDLILPAKALLAGPNGGACDASQVTGVDIERLVYFGASVFWRSAVRAWRVGREFYPMLPMKPDYLEQLRLFLLGEAAFPVNAVSALYVSPSAIPPLSAGYPERVADESPVYYRFYVPGLWLLLVMGEDLSEDTRKMCILRSPVHPIALYTGGDALVHQIGYSLYWNNRGR
jgi:hypothetical protein